MNRFKQLSIMRPIIGLSIVGLSVGLVAATQGCEQVEQAAEACDLQCAEEGIVEGNAAISGVASVDSFFGAVVKFRATAADVRGRVEAQLGKIAVSLGLPANATVAEIESELQAEIDANVDGSIEVVAEPARCSASAEAVVQAKADCEVEAMPPEVQVECSGRCEVEASAEASCDASATMVCTGTPPSLICEGECSGTCELEAGATCEGTCKGECMGSCSVEDANGNCVGQCDGECRGTCELEVAAECQGKCQGECEWEPGEAGCEGSASVSCQAEANASVMCDGRCDGEVTPPSASAECEASVDAQAKMSVDCTPPRLDIRYEFAANVDAEARAEFRAKMTNFGKQYAELLAEIKRADAVLKAGEGLAASATGAVEGSIETAADAAAEGDIRVAVGLGCALAELEEVPMAINGARADLEDSYMAALDLQGAVTSD